MSLTAYLLLAMSSLFVIVNPIAAVPAFIAMHQAQGWTQKAALIVCIGVVALVSCGILRISVQGARWLNPLALKLLTRLMGLLLAAVAVQFAINGLEQTDLFKR